MLRDEAKSHHVSFLCVERVEDKQHLPPVGLASVNSARWQYLCVRSSAAE